MKLWFLATTAILVVPLFSWGEFSLESMTRWQGILGLLAILPAAVILAGLIGPISYGFYVRFVFNVEQYIVLRNGGPFKVGDVVRVLHGPHRGRVGPVYELWGGQLGPPPMYVHVDLGPDAKKDFSDFFEEREVMRA